MPREGHKFSSWSIRSLSTHFNPRAPRGARLYIHGGIFAQNNFNPRAPRGARRKMWEGIVHKATISIHVPREGHDNCHAPQPVDVLISIHVPRERHDAGVTVTSGVYPKFQSTCPARGTTISYYVMGLSSFNFNPRAPREARLIALAHAGYTRDISIHVPREGHD